MNEQISAMQTREVLELMQNLAPILNQKELFEFMLFSNRVLKRYMPEHYNDGLSKEVTEMRKDKAWLKKKMRIRGRHPAENEYVVKQYEQIMELINQLDEPEVPVIPQFVADWIESYRKKTLVELINDAVYSSDEDSKCFKRWFHEEMGFESNYSEFLARAWIDGYEVEKEPRWVIEKGGNYIKTYLIDSNKVVNIDYEPEKEDSLTFLSREEAEAIAFLVGGEVEEVTE